jgi:hypothetical protein
VLVGSSVPIEAGPRISTIPQFSSSWAETRTSVQTNIARVVRLGGWYMDRAHFRNLLRKRLAIMSLKKCHVF